MFSRQISTTPRPIERSSTAFGIAVFWCGAIAIDLAIKLSGRSPSPEGPAATPTWPPPLEESLPSRLRAQIQTDHHERILSTPPLSSSKAKDNDDTIKQCTDCRWTSLSNADRTHLTHERRLVLHRDRTSPITITERWWIRSGCADSSNGVLLHLEGRNHSPLALPMQFTAQECRFSGAVRNAEGMPERLVCDEARRFFEDAAREKWLTERVGIARPAEEWVREGYQLEGGWRAPPRLPVARLGEDWGEKQGCKMEEGKRSERRGDGQWRQRGGLREGSEGEVAEAEASETLA